MTVIVCVANWSAVWAVMTAVPTPWPVANATGPLVNSVTTPELVSHDVGLIGAEVPSS